MKEKELQIVKYLRINGRETLTRLSKKTGVPISTLFDKLNEYREKLIVKHTCLIDYPKLGFDLRVQILFKLPKQRHEFEEFLISNFQVNSVYKINNGYDYLVEAVFRNMKEFTEFLQTFDRFPIKERKEFYVLQDLKREAFLTTDTHVAMLAKNDL